MRRIAKFAAVAVLVTVPASYLVIASLQSLAGSERKEEVAAATEPLWGRPDRATQNIYRVRLPDYSWGNRFFETNSWKTSSLYLRFEASSLGLDAFLSQLGTSRSALVDGYVPITAEQQRTVGWNFHGPWAKKQKLAGVVLPAEGKGKPGHRLVVNFADEFYPTVFVVSTITY